MVSALADGSPGNICCTMPAGGQLVARGIMPVGFIVMLMKPFKLSEQTLILWFHPVVNFGNLGIAHSLNGVLLLHLHLSLNFFYCFIHIYFAFNLYLSRLRSRHSDQCNAFSKNGVFSQWVLALKLSSFFLPKVRPELSSTPLCDRPSSSSGLEGSLVGVYSSPC